MSRQNRGQSAAETARGVSRLFRAIAHKYRRAVIRVLDETHTPVSHNALATYVAKELFPECAGTNFIRFRERMVVKLHHIHLPMLADVGIIKEDDGVITPGARLTETVTLLEEVC